MYKDKDGEELSVGSTILVDGCLYIVRDFMVYELAVEVLCEDKLSHNFKTFQLRDVLKIS